MRNRSIRQSKATSLPEIVHTLPPPDGFVKERPNLTPLSASSGKVLVNCDNCALEYLKPVAWAKRSARHYCSKSCLAAGKIKRLQMACVSCGKPLFVTPSYASRGDNKTCSKPCEGLHRANLAAARQRDERGAAFVASASLPLTASAIGQAER